MRDFGRVNDVVRFNTRIVLLEFGNGVRVFVDEDGTAFEICRSPEERLVGEAEDEEVAGGAFGVNDGGDGGEFGERH